MFLVPQTIQKPVFSGMKPIFVVPKNKSVSVFLDEKPLFPFELGCRMVRRIWKSSTPGQRRARGCAGLVVFLNKNLSCLVLLKVIFCFWT